MFMQRQIAILVLCLTALAGCEKKTPEEKAEAEAQAKVESSGLIGTWSGTVLIVGVEFTFTPDTYIQRTFSFNRIQVGGSKGSISVDGNIIKVHRTHEYRFDNDTNKGAWFPQEQNYTIEYKIEGKSITLKPSTTTDSMTLTRE